MSDVVWDPSGTARQALTTAVAEQGVAALSSPNRLENLLKDLLPDMPREASLLVAAAQVNMAAMLKDRIDSGVDAGTAIRLGAATLGQGRPFDPSACQWVAREFALAMGLEVGQDAEVGWPTGPTPSPSPPTAVPTPAPTLDPWVNTTPVLGAAPHPREDAPTPITAPAAPVLAWPSVPSQPSGPSQPFGPPQPSGPWAPGPPGPSGPPGAPPPRSRRVLIIATIVVLALIVVIGGGAAALELNQHGTSSTTTSTGTATTTTIGPGTSTTGTVPPTTPTSLTTDTTAPAIPPGLTTIAGYLAQSAAARAEVSHATEGVQNCTEDPTAALTPIRAGLAIRQGIAGNLKNIDLSGVSGGTQLLANLRAAINDSVNADQAFVAWVMDVEAANAQGGQGQPSACSQYQSDSNWQAANVASTAATNDKTQFVSEWNPLAATYGLKQYPADGF